MDPRFSGLFVHPNSHKPLAFFGTVQGGNGVPVHVICQGQGWSEEILNAAEKGQGEKWITSGWENGLLWSLDDPEMYPVIEGIPVFVPPSGQQWTPLSIRRMREEKRIERNWTNAGREVLTDRSDVERFSREMAENGGLILDIASGPGGGFAPRILHTNPEATILMDDLGLGVLMEWQRLLKEKEIPNVSFGLFDANKMPLASDSVDTVSDLGGFDNIGTFDAARECHRVLKKGGTLYSVNSVVEKEDFGKLPEQMRKRCSERNQSFFEGILDSLKNVGFRVESNTFLRERELRPEEGDLPREADKHGVRLRVKHYCTKAAKE